MKKSQFKFPCVGSAVTKFQYRFNNYKNTHPKFQKKLKKELFKKLKQLN